MKVQSRCLQGLILLITIVAPLISAEKGISCEKLENVVLYSLHRSEMRACLMKETTAINTTGTIFTTPRDESIETISFALNKKIQFLPENTGEIFPNSIAMSAGNCSVKSISRINFKGLQKLLGLYLFSNLIEQIESDTFQDLLSLEVLDLGNNRIKSLNEPFNPLVKHRWVNLIGNVCINERFLNGSIAQLNNVVHEKCGVAAGNVFAGSRNPNPTINDIPHGNCENHEEMKALRTQLNAANQEIARKQKMEIYLRESFAGKMRSKIQRVADLSAKLNTMNSEIAIRDAKIRQLEKLQY